jgi:hypothetical protein
MSTIPFWVDASTSWGIGVVFENVWKSWKLCDGWDEGGHHIGWAEMVAVEFGLRLAIHRGYSDIHFHVHSDNEGVIGALDGGKSRNPEQNRVLRRIVSLMRSHSIWMTITYVRSDDNIADKPSRGEVPIHAGFSPAPSSFKIPYCLKSLVRDA